MAAQRIDITGSHSWALSSTKIYTSEEKEFV
jgi:hypothetical protein